MTIYLYVKTHNVTGLKYLGQTSSNDPYKYQGSGKYWRLHLKKHGNNVTTEILKECESKADIKEWGIYYSKLWNVVESEQWANLKEECGDGGRQSEEVRRRIGEAGKGRIPWNKGKQMWSAHEREQIGIRNSNRGPQSAETIAKRVEKNTGKRRSDEQKQRASAAQKGRTLTEDHKAKLKEAAQKRTAPPWNKGLKLAK